MVARSEQQVTSKLRSTFGNEFVHRTMSDGQHADGLARFADLVKNAVDVRFRAVEQMAHGALRPPSFRSQWTTPGKPFEDIDGFLKPVVPAGCRQGLSDMDLLIEIVEVAGGADSQFNVVCHDGGGGR